MAANCNCGELRRVKAPRSSESTGDRRGGARARVGVTTLGHVGGAVRNSYRTCRATHRRPRGRWQGRHRRTAASSRGLMRARKGSRCLWGDGREREAGQGGARGRGGNRRSSRKRREKEKLEEEAGKGEASRKRREKEKLERVGQMWTGENGWEEVERRTGRDPEADGRAEGAQYQRHAVEQRVASEQRAEHNYGARGVA